MTDDPTSSASSAKPKRVRRPAGTARRTISDGCPHTLNPGAVCRYCRAALARGARP